MLKILQKFVLLSQLLFIFSLYQNSLTRNSLIKNLHNAIVTKNEREATELLTRKPTLVHHKRYNVIPFLNTATRCGSLFIIQQLLKCGASLSLADDDGKTPLHIATEFNNVEALRLFLEHGAPPDQTDNCDNTSLHIAAEHNHREAIHILFKWGASLNKKNNNGTTPLGVASLHNAYDAAQQLLDYGALVDASNNFFETPLHFAAREGNENLVRLLLNHNATVNVTTHHKQTPLSFATQRNHHKVIEILLKNNAHVDVPNASHLTPLMLSLIKKSGTHRLLLPYNPDASLVDAQNNTAYHWAIVRDYQEGIKDLLEYESNHNQLESSQKKELFSYAAKKGKTEILKLFVDYGINESENESIIFDLVKLFMQQITETTVALTVPHNADQLYASIFFLLQQGVDPNNQNILEPIHIAIQRSKVKTPLLPKLYVLLEILFLHGLHFTERYFYLIQNAFQRNRSSEILSEDTFFLSNSFAYPTASEMRSIRYAYARTFAYTLLTAIAEKNEPMVGKLLLYGDPDMKITIPLSKYPITITPYSLIASLLKQSHQKDESLKRILNMLSARIKIEFNYLYKILTHKALRIPLPLDLVWVIFNHLRNYPQALLQSIYVQSDDNQTLLALLSTVPSPKKNCSLGNVKEIFSSAGV